jgi:hypothetical protein
MKSAQSTLPQLTPVSTVSYKTSPFCCHSADCITTEPQELKAIKGKPIGFFTKTNPVMNNKQQTVAPNNIYQI